MMTKNPVTFCLSERLVYIDRFEGCLLTNPGLSAPQEVPEVHL